MAAGPEIRRHGKWWRMGRLAALLLLAGCSGPKAPATIAAPVKQPTVAALPPYAVKPGGGTECVPYARARSGIGIFGDAYTWWATAVGHYARGSKPAPGSVLVLQRTSRLRHGHLSVVTAVVGPREIRVDHANWQPDAVITSMPVIDVSPANDWSLLRFWNQEARVWGGIYPAAGFIYNAPDKIEDAGTTISSNGSGAYWAAHQPLP